MDPSIPRPRALLSVLAAVLVSGCATAGPRPLPVTVRSLVDDYVMVRGMAAGRLFSRDLDRTAMLRIVGLDHAALLSLAALAADPRNRALKAQADAAIRALSDEAASAPPMSATLVVRGGGG